MSRETYVWDRERGRLVRKSEFFEPVGRRAFDIVPDISERLSPIDGTVIHTRRDLTNHNRRHGVIDIGNDKSGFNRRTKTPGGLKDDIMRAVSENE